MASSTRYAQSLAFLLSQVGAQSASLFAQALADLGVSPRAFGVLSNLAAAEGQTQQQLADALGMHRNNMVDSSTRWRLRAGSAGSAATQTGARSRCSSPRPAARSSSGSTSRCR